MQISIQLRRAYQRGGYGGYGRIAVITHTRECPQWVPIRKTRNRRILRDSGILYAGKMVSSELAIELAHVQREYPDAAVFS